MTMITIIAVSTASTFLITIVTTITLFLLLLLCAGISMIKLLNINIFTTTTIRITTTCSMEKGPVSIGSQPHTPTRSDSPLLQRTVNNYQ